MPLPTKKQRRVKGAPKGFEPITPYLKPIPRADEKGVIQPLPPTSGLRKIKAEQLKGFRRRMFRRDI